MPIPLFRRLFEKRRRRSSAVGKLLAQAREFLQQNELSRALSLCQQALAEDPDDPDTLLLSADISVAQHDQEGAIRFYTAAASSTKNRPRAYYKLANLLRDAGRLQAASEAYSSAISCDPQFAAAFCNRGVVLERLGRPAEALRDFDQAIALNPSDGVAYYNRAGTLRTLQQPHAALADYSRAVDLNPSQPEAECNKGLLLTELDRLDEALECYQRCIASNPAFHYAYFYRGALLQQQKDWRAALKSYDEAIRLQPNFAEAFCNRGVVLTSLQRWDEAITNYSQALSFKADFAEALANRAEAYLQLSRFQDASTDYELAFALDSELRFLAGARLHARMNLCEWRDFDSSMADLRARIDAGLRASHPLHVLGLLDSPSKQQSVAVTWVQEMYPPDNALGALVKRPPPERLRIAYFSPDFREHPVAQLVADLFDLHDRSRFEIIGFSLGDDTQDRYRRRFEKSFDRFIDVRLLSSKEIASLARAMEIDIAVDLAGHTALSRPDVFALQAAPLQVNYLGYPGTMGASYMDYIIADEIVIPHKSSRYFTEKVAYLPDCYLFNSKREIGPSRSRPELGLPANATVFCCFNNQSKILPGQFDLWMHILKQVPEGILWLRGSNAVVTDNIKRTASDRGVDPDRIIFAARVPAGEHLARFRAADLFLDTHPFNAHTTACDALLAGLPLVTCSGESFTSRVATSLLTTLNLNELIATSPEEYVGLAVELARDRDKLSFLRNKLAKQLESSALLNTRRHTQNIEAAFTSMYERYTCGLPPTDMWASGV